MQHTSEKLEKSQVKFNYSASKEEFDNARSSAYQATKGKYNVPGFRKGHAPRKVIEGMYGEGVFDQDALNKLVDDAVSEVEHDGSYEIVEFTALQNVDYKKDGGVSFEIIAVVSPEVKLGAYKNLGIKKDAVKVAAKDVDEKIKETQEKQARLVDIDAAAENGNTVLIDFEGSVDGVPFDGGKADNYELELGSNTFIPGFEDQLVGVKAGDVKDVNVTFPDDYGAEELKSKAAVFKCTVKAVRKKELPAIDDDFAKEVSDFDTLAEYKASVKKELEDEANERAEAKFEDDIVEKVVSASEVEIPDIMIEREIDADVKDLEMRAMNYGLTMDSYLEHMGKTMAELRKDYREHAEKSVKVRLVLQALIKEEKIDITNEDFEARIQYLADRSHKTVDEVKKTMDEEAFNYVANSAVFQKLMDVLKSLNTVKKAEKAESDGEVKETKPAAKKTSAKKTAPKAE